MKLTKDQVRLGRDKVKHVAKLANLPLTPEEEEKYSEQLSKILDYIDQLNSVDTKGVEPTFNVSGLSNVMRKDESLASLTQEEALQNPSQKQEGFFVTKRVIGEENG
ncbi:asparaginyl/glutamyl-tRNA amidotransferase subunit C [Candidatus Daviesbacteria bacterium RIFCSPLOWO2_01_FULL_39_12]|uniref:Aspartyl/glutamyl-tRNA(Asn/Gln) amidotransferase subunit C n=1 Tax=Candidatus Daviesbacteria bacterium RIFCSPLOWO2_01_FULL_39_12 TaxID=1797785 RepID=A0A1F5KT48_9BACT|nr:MAG: asparaginyl/glutamyl-tRNA amidotransferase subunit C [Candidatus Daviesbacteria bacterium RIFCSPHIGHO2_02_FULL_39_8]OGE43995.1 MAG: asparaginyl/glutamyl-tRNA amidotransferase subunit C [Candidatus Daviesbacteria bacterium RIFCSPLOWO2_01_FULL_39_12]